MLLQLISFIGIIVVFIIMIVMLVTFLTTRDIQMMKYYLSNPIDVTIIDYIITLISSFIVFLIAFSILSTIGSIFLGIMFMRLAEEPKVDSLFETAGMIWIIAVVLTDISYTAIIGLILIFVSMILILIAAGNSLKSLLAHRSSHLQNGEVLG